MYGLLLHVMGGHGKEAAEAAMVIKLQRTGGRVRETVEADTARRSFLRIRYQPVHVCPHEVLLLNQAVHHSCDPKNNQDSVAKS